MRALAASVNDTPDPVVTGFYVWGPWVNGGAWLTIGGQRVDFLYRSLEHQARVIADANAGRFELHWGQQAPFGFFGPTYLGELAICRPLFDPDGRVAALKRAVADYPEPLRRAIVQTYLWQTEFSLESFAPKFAARGEVLGAAGCLTRLAHQLVLVLFALNRRYLLSDKTALAEIDRFELAPPRFGERVAALLASLGESPTSSLRRWRPRPGWSPRPSRWRGRSTGVPTEPSIACEVSGRLSATRCADAGSRTRALPGPGGPAAAARTRPAGPESAAGSP